jgi:hypothetical protein
LLWAHQPGSAATPCWTAQPGNSALPDIPAQCCIPHYTRGASSGHAEEEKEAKRREQLDKKREGKKQRRKNKKRSGTPCVGDAVDDTCAPSTSADAMAPSAAPAKVACKVETNADAVLVMTTAHGEQVQAKRIAGGFGTPGVAPEVDTTIGAPLSNFFRLLHSVWVTLMLLALPTPNSVLVP